MNEPRKLNTNEKLEQVTAVVYAANSSIGFAFSDEEVAQIVSSYESRGSKAYVFKKDDGGVNIKEQIHRYFVAVHGSKYGYRAPETFGNAVEQWMLALGAGNMEAAEEAIVGIEAHFKSLRGE